MRYRLLLPEWAQTPKIPKAIERDNCTAEYLAEKNAQGYGIYYLPNYNSQPLDHNYIAGADVDTWECCYVDMDLKDGHYTSPEEFIEVVLAFELPPCKLVVSGNGVHAYWYITDLTRETFVPLQMKLIKKFKTDPVIWTVMRIMRLEGYYNTKNPNEFKLVEYFEPPHKENITVAELSAYLPDLTEQELARADKHLRKMSGLDPIEIEDGLDLDSLPTAFSDLMETNKHIRDIMFDDTIGGRSTRAAHLTHILSERGYNRFDAITIIANTPKWINRSDRLVRATEIVDQVYRKDTRNVVPCVTERLRQFATKPARSGRVVDGPYYFDCNVNKWKTQQVFGLVAGTGVGKSTVSLDIFKHMIQNNPNSTDVFVFFNLEMADWDIIERWVKLIEGKTSMSDRLYVVSNEDDSGNPRHLNLQDIYWHCQDIMKVSGRKIGAICIDHIAVINPTINIRKEPSFGMVGEMDGAFGDLRCVSPRKMPQLLKELAKQLDCFLIIQSQTTKAQGLHGDTPLGVSAAYGASQFEHFCDYVMTLYQPIRRVYWKTALRVMGWRYCKIRHMAKNDTVKTYDDRGLIVDVDTGNLREFTEAEERELEQLLIECDEMRKKEEKKTSVTIRNSPSVTRFAEEMRARLALKKTGTD